MPWEFRPRTAKVQVNPGRAYVASYVAQNHASRAMIGQAVPSVAPAKAAKYLKKTECFCFDQQRLAAGESKEMPVRFIIDPALPQELTTISLSYTFFDATGRDADG